MVEAAPKAGAIDEYLKDMIQAVYAACAIAMPHTQDADPTVVDKAIEDSKELLGVVMAGKVDDWLN